MPNFLVQAAIMIAISLVMTGLQMLLAPKPRQQLPRQQQARPKPSDGKYNLKQNVPGLPVILGTCKVGGQYVFLEEANGTAHHVLVLAGHRVHSVETYYLHDEKVLSLNGSGGVLNPVHFTGDNGASGGSNVALKHKLGLDAETAWSELVSAFPSIWTSDHRGDGLAQLYMACNTVAEDKYNEVYPQQMPQVSAVVKGALVFDPREPSHDPNDPNTWAFSENIALLRLWHLTHPSGGKQSLENMYLPAWQHAADVCDQLVVNREGVSEPRYHGGLFYNAIDADPVDIGAILDEAGELVVYENEDGLISVHAGELVEPDVRLTSAELLSITVDVNKRIRSNVLAVRGRFTEPGVDYNTVDAAIYGDPYIPDDSTQRTRVVDNSAVQRHNHMQRLQKLAFYRANAMLVSGSVAYNEDSTSKLLAQRRFIRIHFPDRGLVEALVELKGKPKLSLGKENMSISFEGRVMPENPYAFDAATEEGEPQPIPGKLDHSGVPTPTGFTITIEQASVDGSILGAYGEAAWDTVSEALQHELEWQPFDESAVPRVVRSRPGESKVRTEILTDGVKYRFRLRAISNNLPSPWTAYVAATATANPVAPTVPTDFASSRLGSTVTITWTAANDRRLFATRIWRNTVNDFSSASMIYEAIGSPGVTRTYDDTSLASGTYYYWATSVNSSYLASAEVGPATETVP